jgi:phosphopantetheinyl transferase (holo-ACP synthase)
MVGNDVVDLGDPETRAGVRHPRFDARVFAPEELAVLGFHPEPQRLRWVLWAAKEAAFKVARKRAPATVFAPRRFRVTLAPGGVGRVRWEGGELLLQVACGSDWVHAVASSPGSEGIYARRLVVPPAISPGAAVREHALHALRRLLGAPLAIGKAGRIPFLRRGTQRLRADLSLSHHGRYAAWVCELSPRGEGLA